MNPRVAVALVWGLLVTVALILIPPLLRDRLPDPMATHWGPGGADGSSPLTAALTAQVLVWVVPWLIALAMALRGRVLVRRLGRIYWCAAVAFWSVMALGMAGTMLLANLDVPDWTRAELPGSHVAALVLVAAAAGALAGFLGRGGPDQAPAAGEQPPSLRLRPGERTVWVSRIGNPWLVAVSVAGVATLSVVVVLGLVGAMPGAAAGTALPALAITLVVALATASLTARVSEDGLAIGFGPFGWPVRRIRLSQILSAYPEERFPSQVGGWGFRGMSGSATIMLRGGECLIIRYRSGGQLAISIDDAARGASLINALIAERVEQ
ncbi:hypothetical protein [Nonomuraea jiangxiensis]|uniref:DUF1648 domain-containing protein n=1 Tax=Nonomuraea jiangxiensis TaxID=633440 RepID=A0A1G8RCL5_9ACTN|nr:hypothetical protein [Nonomuraea jiangxiensis]SDJ14120.1 hypothetical protein SAMN05421869_10915 [Nonomuraea jiangxiensis]